MTRENKKQRSKRTISWAAALTCCTLVLFTTTDIARSQSASVKPEYNANGDLKVPQGYETWVFVGSNLGLGYKQSLPAMTAAEAERVERGSFHNIYISPGAYRQFIKKGTFPDPTILVMEHYVAEDKEPRGIVDKGVFNGKRSGLEVAVKNTKRPDGSQTPWAYYVFTDREDPSKVKPEAEAFTDSACYQCHLEHASTDNVWVQFYPILRKFEK